MHHDILWCRRHTTLQILNPMVTIQNLLLPFISDHFIQCFMQFLGIRKQYEEEKREKVGKITRAKHLHIAFASLDKIPFFRRIFSIITRLATYCRQCYRHVTSFTTYHNRNTVLTIRMVRRCFEMTHLNLTGRICEYSTQINPNGCTCGPGQVMKNNNIMDIYRDL